MASTEVSTGYTGVQFIHRKSFFFLWINWGLRFIQMSLTDRGNDSSFPCHLLKWSIIEFGFEKSWTVNKHWPYTQKKSLYFPIILQCSLWSSAFRAFFNNLATGCTIVVQVCHQEVGWMKFSFLFSDFCYRFWAEGDQGEKCRAEKVRKKKF